MLYTENPESTVTETGLKYTDETSDKFSQMGLQDFILAPSGEENVYILEPITATSEKNLSTLSENIMLDEGNIIPQPVVMEENEWLPDLNITYNVDLESITKKRLLDDIDTGSLTSNPTVKDNTEENNDKASLIENGGSEQHGYDKLTDYEEVVRSDKSQQVAEYDEVQISEDSGPEEEGSEENNHSREVTGKRKRSKRGKADKDSWTAQKNQMKRLKGEEYLGRRKNEEGQTVFDVKRDKREVKPRCLCSTEKKTVFQCYRVTEEMREKMFRNFWSLTWGERKILVQLLVDRRSVLRRRVESSNSRRKGSLFYYLNVDRKEKVRVCKTMFLNTLSIGEWMVFSWVSNFETTQEQGKINENTRKNISNNQKNLSDEKRFVRTFFDSLPKLESHYCRKDTNKLYFEQRWNSKAELYRLYQSYSKSQNKEYLISSIFTFYSVFDECNLGIFSPKKDQCDVCCTYNMGNLDREQYNSHISRKEEARNQKKI